MRFLSKLCSFEPDLFIAVLKLSTNRSANPLVYGWYGLDVMWRTPHSNMNARNSLDVKRTQLSVTILSAYLNLENVYR